MHLRRSPVFVALTPSPGTPGEGKTEGEALRRGEGYHFSFTTDQKKKEKTLTLPSPGVPGEGKIAHPL